MTRTGLHMLRQSVPDVSATKFNHTGAIGADPIVALLPSLKYLALFFPLIPFDMSIIENTRGHAMRAAIIALMLMIGSQAGAAVWDPNNFELRKLTSITVVLQDNASGACWTNLKEVREYAEEKLRMKGVKIDNEAYVSLEANRYNFDIEVIG
ncbi:hypothetical protein N9C16_05280 [Paracoccaceae bacterium]|nr:hypothetical protein [Paracoccaceae bacterium]